MKLQSDKFTTFEGERVSKLWLKYKDKRLDAGIYVRKNSPYFWTKIKARRESTETDSMLYARTIAARRRSDASLIPTVVRHKTIKALREEYEHELDKQVAEKAITAETRRADLSRIDKFIAYTPAKTIKHISEKVIQDFIRAYAVKPKTKLHAKSAINKMLSFAVKQGYTNVNPTSGVTTPKQERRLPTLLTRAEATALLTTAKPYQLTLYLFLIYTGIRIGEAIKIQWSQIKLDEGYILRKAPQTKDREDEMMPLHDDLCQHLRSISDGKSGNVILNSEGNPYKNTHAARGAFKAHLERLGIERTEGTLFHLFRHTFATNMLEDSGDLRLVQELLGHAHIAQTTKYTHVLMAKKTAGMKNFTGYKVTN